MTTDYSKAPYPFSLIATHPEGMVWKREARNGRVVDAIKALREFTKQEVNEVLGLKEAKDVVESYINYVRVLETTKNIVELNKGVALHVYPMIDGSFRVEHVSAMDPVRNLEELLTLVVQLKS